MNASPSCVSPTSSATSADPHAALSCRGCSTGWHRLARDGQIRFDISPFTPRDFLPVEACARLLACIIAAPPGGVLNVGSGIALPVGRVALWVLEGYGRGELVIESLDERDGFVLDVTRLTSLYGPPCSLDDLRSACLGLGRCLASEVG